MKRLLCGMAILYTALGCQGPQPTATMPAAPAPTAPAPTAAAPRGDRLRAAIDRAVAAYVFIGGGSGTIISPDGLVITNAHVAGSTRRWRIKGADGTGYQAEVIGTAPETDLALLTIRGHAEPLPHLPLGDSDALDPGDPVLAVGNPFGLGSLDHQPTVTLGVVSAIHVNRTRAGDAVVTDAPINPGNSGGALANLDGELVGVNGQIASRYGLRTNTGAGFAISSRQVQRYLPALKQARGGVVYAGTLNGLSLANSASEPAKVARVLDDSGAAEAGLAAGDVILSVDDWPVSNAFEALAALARNPAGTSIPLTVRRDGQTETLLARLESQGRAALGVVLAQDDPQSLKVEKVTPRSPADRAGIQVGDVLRRIGRYRLNNRSALQRLMRRLRPGAEVPIAVERDGKLVRMTVTLGITPSQ